VKKINLASLIILLFFFVTTCDKSNDKQSSIERMLDTSQRTKTILIKPQITLIINAVNSYFTDNNEYPEFIDQLIPQYLETKSHIIDPWRTPFKLENDDGINIFLISAGRDCIFGTKDDIKRRI